MQLRHPYLSICSSRLNVLTEYCGNSHIVEIRQNFQRSNKLGRRHSCSCYQACGGSPWDWVELSLEQGDGNRAVHGAGGREMNMSHQQLSDSISYKLVGDVVAVSIEADKQKGFAHTWIVHRRKNLASCRCQLVLT